MHDSKDPPVAAGRLARVLDSIQDHVVQYDREWRYVYVNDAATQVLGKSREELIGRRIWDLFPAAEGNPYHEDLKRAVETGEVVRAEFFYGPFGRWFENHIYPGPEGVTVFSADITRRKAAELALRELEQRHQALVDVMPAGMYWADAEGIVRYYNRRAAELWGRAPDLARETVRFCGSFRLYTPAGEPVAHADCFFARALATGTPVRDREAVIERPDGSRITVLVNIDVVRDTGGRIVGAVNVLQDITERIRAEEATAWLAAIVESSQDAVIGKDITGRVISWNAAAERLYGYKAEEIIGQPAALLLPAGQRDEEDRILARIRAGERVERLESVRMRRSGEPVELSVTVSPVRDASGRIIGASSVAHDISQRKAHERALRESEARYRSLVEAAGAIVVRSDAQGDWVEPQPGWQAYTGQTFQEYRGRGWLAALHPDDRDRVRDVVAESVARGIGWHGEGRLWHTASGTYRYQEARIVPIRGSDGTVQEWIAACQDIHARKSAEESVREADRRKDEFLAVLAHELRNPLAPIVSSLQILRMPDAQVAQASVLDVLERQVHHLVRLVDDLMEVSRITQGAIELRRETLAIADVLNAAVEISRPLLDAHGHRLEVHVGAGAPMVCGDRVRLTQIVANLLNNAAKYTARGGRVRVSVEASGDEALVRVADNGAGIAPEMQQRIFEMFVRGTRPSERFAGGLGIGLGLSRRLAELHGGALEVASEGEGKGSVFTLRLPLVERADLPLKGAAVQASVTARRVLVVDDNRDAAEALAALLRALGHEVHTVHRGDEALRAAEQMRPDVALLDLGMPAPDGYEVARELRQRDWGARVRLIAVSGWGQEAERRRSRECGFDLHLVKPVSVDVLRGVLVS